MNLFFKLVFIFGVVLQTYNCNFTLKHQKREHKIHNIVLYPDKDSWCKTTNIVQVVSHPGCSSVKLDNNVCVGACFSYIVPRTFPETPGDVLPYCDSCRPVRTSWKKVTLECTEGRNKNQNLTKHVELIHDCSCEMCKDIQVNKLTNDDVIDTDPYNSDTDTSDEYNNTADILDVKAMSTTFNSTNNELKNAVSGLLKILNNEDEDIMENTDGIRGLHKNVWKSLLDKIESMNNTIDQSVLTQLIKSVEEESKTKLNYKRLKQALMKFKKYQDTTKANTKLDEIVGPHNSKVLPTDAEGSYASGLYIKFPPKLPASGTEQDTVLSMSDAHKYLQRATGALDISHNNNVEGVNLTTNENDKSENQTVFKDNTTTIMNNTHYKN